MFRSGSGQIRSGGLRLPGDFLDLVFTGIQRLADHPVVFQLAAAFFEGGFTVRQFFLEPFQFSLSGPDLPLQGGLTLLSDLLLLRLVRLPGCRDLCLQRPDFVDQPFVILQAVLKLFPGLLLDLQLPGNLDGAFFLQFDFPPIGSLPLRVEGSSLGQLFVFLLEPVFPFPHLRVLAGQPVEPVLGHAFQDGDRLNGFLVGRRLGRDGLWCVLRGGGCIRCRSRFRFNGFRYWLCRLGRRAFRPPGFENPGQYRGKVIDLEGLLDVVVACRHRRFQHLLGKLVLRIGEQYQ